MLARIALVAVLLVTPWMYGGVYESTQLWIVGAVLGALVLALPEIARNERRTSVAFWLLFAAVVWGALQIAPLPAPVIATVSPGTAALRAELLPAAGTAEDALAEAVSFTPSSAKQTFSLRPSATRPDLIWLTVAAIAFLLGQQLFASPRAAAWLCGCVAANGAALAFFGLVQKLTWNGQIFWVGMEPAGTPFATFGNRNNAAGYLNLCLAAALGVAIWASRSGDGDQPTAGRRRRVRSPSLHGVLGQLDTAVLSVFVLAICLIAAIFCTLSRGGGISLLAAGCLSAVAVGVAYRRTGQAAWLAIALVAGIGLVAWVGMVDVLEARFLTLSEPERLSAAGRFPNWIDALHTVPDFPLFGSGLGTYRDIYLLYEHRFAPAWYFFAENQYVQAVVDAGIVGLLLMLAVLGAVAAACLRLLRDARRAGRPDYVMLGQVGLFAVATQSVHAVFDFGLYVPANMLLMATLCGAVAGAATELRRELRPGPRASNVSRRGPLIAAILLLLAAGWWSLDLYRSAVVARALRETHFSQTPTAATDEQLATAIARLMPLTERRSDDAELHYQLAKLHTLRYRVARFLVLREQSPPEIPLDDVWELTSTTSLHAAVYDSIRDGELEEVERLRESALVREHLRPAIRSLLAAREACPLLAKVHLRLGRLAVLAGTPIADAIHIERAARCEPATPYVRTRAGRLHAQAGRLESACRDWREILAIDRGQLDVILPWAREMLDEEHMAEQMLPAQPDFLVEVAARQFAGDEYEALRASVLERALRLVDQAELASDERAYVKGRALTMQGRYQEAVEPYRIAVDLRPQEVRWQYELAVLLRDLGRFDDAHDYAVFCSRLEPENRRYRSLVEELVRLRVRGR